MRKPDYGIIPDAVRAASKERSLAIFRRMCLSRYFETGIIDAVADETVDYPVYLSMGQESIPAALAEEIGGFMIFAQHRCHAAYLAFGGDPAKLRDELMGLPTGTSGGRAGSNCVQCHSGGLEMFGHHGLIGENVPLAVGASLGSGKPAVCFFGDGAAEEDYVFAAMGFAVTHKLPVLFVCEDNNLSILTEIRDRRSWSITKVAAALYMPAVDIADDPWSVAAKVAGLKKNLPAFMNIYTCRARWHVGAGIDGPPAWDRFALVKEELLALGLGNEAAKIENEVRAFMTELWKK
ncbi:MAG: hypothetical protein CVU77_00720 [Elusimicrobia bacterium HGW-Elusimicrobia-1]|jgi:pyruvate dehydrogenase E1 component alpha subunit|nr:MAG: hypothetical protein CVU77_00720 [Elusimicrobia bacterium HGW-Elusimicrobia-1]